MRSLKHYADAWRRARELSSQDIGGFDQRRLIKLELDSRLSPDELTHISREVEIVSQEESTVALAFATDTALTDSSGA